MYAHRENDKPAYSVVGIAVQSVPDSRSPRIIPKCGQKIPDVSCPIGGLVPRQIRLSAVGLSRVVDARLFVTICIRALRCAQ